MMANEYSLILLPQFDSREGPSVPVALRVRRPWPMAHRSSYHFETPSPTPTQHVNPKECVSAYMGASQPASTNMQPTNEQACIPKHRSLPSFFAQTPQRKKGRLAPNRIQKSQFLTCIKKRLGHVHKSVKLSGVLAAKNFKKKKKGNKNVNNPMLFRKYCSPRKKTPKKRNTRCVFFAISFTQGYGSWYQWRRPCVSVIFWGGCASSVPTRCT